MNIDAIPHEPAKDLLSADAHPENMGPRKHTAPSVTNEHETAPVNFVFPTFREATGPVAIEDPTQPERCNGARLVTAQAAQHGRSKSNVALQQRVNSNERVDVRNHASYQDARHASIRRIK